MAVVNAMKTTGTLSIQFSYFLALENSTQRIASAFSRISI
jgi:hypothetical protein